MKYIYLDHSATTPINKEVLKAMRPYLGENFGNPSSLHYFGQKARKGVEDAREKIANFLNCKNDEVFFTSGATESNNLAIFGLIKKIRKQNKDRKLHIITSVIEHPAVLEVFDQLKKEGIEVSYLPVTKNGLVLEDDLKKAIKSETLLVSIMYVNNEVGTIQPIAEIGKLLEEINKKRTPEEKIYFHTDAVQAANYCDCKVSYLGVDMLSFSGHKIYGPKGVGALYVKKGTPISAIVYGGHQEQSLRSGTENVAGIVGMAKAIEMIGKKDNLKIRKLRDEVAKKLLAKIPDAIYNGDREKRIPSNANFCFKNVEGESILLMLDMEGIAISTGSACSSGSLKPSHVLLAMGVPQEVSHGSVRITLGKENTKEEIQKLIKALPPIIKKLREMSPIK
ncbi:cysteine desulfurase NifS [Candidatus Falkowbacteria bacterium RIFOXYB2_FULL_38_15]|uniref:cysteine desulfurase n=1 Tax=Candidatus Falkowbacteria bacterium RIFOXYA2_FULL_38_12 TaxID=1797993 RepID=A0A1F5S4B5_9BACT|nr:MAG: cysteine desulfurase NifS [Candidatus Falkowbacteria bacterium RIFOXYA2_FULL_38_12]OGF33120.1 MAG: cysteine desulfurase NifS [Candidatus Falkowbacteria bacterium RIFOXYB2_FULL_38_15]OGF43961.1 MAG: cysteine desulfurase NifS [Candidatus Falkowbacteria bacterium RIFOXYD2_FULL_39_16]